MQATTTFNIEDSFGEFAKAGALAEASAFPTVQTGPYRLQITKSEGKKFDGDPRPYAHLTVSVMNEDGAKRLSTAWVDATWVEGRDAKGDLDRGFRYWDELTRALYPDLKAYERADKDVGTVLADAKLYPISGFVVEKFKVAGAWVKAKTADDRAKYKGSAEKVINTVSNFRPLK